MAIQNSINKKTANLTIDPGAAGDSTTQFSINGTPEFIIGVDDTDDSFRIANGNALGTTDHFIMSAAGERTMPLQPAFLAYLGTTDSNVTGDGSAFIIGSGNALTEVFDQNSDFVTSGTFTASVTGKFLLGFNFEYADIGAAHTNELTYIVTSNRIYQGTNFNPYGLQVSGHISVNNDILVDMDAADTATFEAKVLNGTKIVDIVGGGDNVTNVYGYLAT